MKGDFTRFTFRPKNHFSGVRLQQGRVLLDAEWNEQADIESYLDQTTTADVVGDCGAPIHDAGFALLTQVNSNVWTQQIGAGRCYVGGLLCENESNVAFAQQPDLPGASLPTAVGTYLAYLDVWQRHLTAIERPELREVALGGPDSATRAKTVWQVKLTPVAANSTCAQFGGDWTPPNMQSTGQLRAQAEPVAQTTNECLVPPGAGYRRLENQLYRVEIQTPGTPGAATFKWSRDNGGIVSGLVNIAGNAITVSDAGKDSVLGFAGAKFIELSDEGRTLRNEPGVLLEVDVTQANIITVKGWPGAPLTMADFGALPTVRCWEGAATVTAGQMINLEDGVQIEFAAAGQFRTGDYWTIPARSLTGKVEWPRDNNGAIFESRHGVEHHYCPLGLLQLAGATWTRLSDCRQLFPPLTELTSFFYLSGDGQEAMPHTPALPRPLQVGVANGKFPVANAPVRFRVTAGTGALTGGTASPPGIIVLTNAAGVAECNWTLDATNQSQQVESTLADGSHLPIRFNANLSRASAVSYTPTSQCPDLVTANVLTVKEAIDRLCQSISPEPGIHIVSLELPAIGPLRHDANFPPSALLDGLIVQCDATLGPESVSRGSFLVTVEMPQPQPTSPTPPQVFGYSPMNLNGDLNVSQKTIQWQPSQPLRTWLQQSLPAILNNLPERRMLTRLTLKGNFIWDQDARLFLDGEAFPLPPGESPNNLKLPSGDGRRGGDFEMWFWLALPPLLKVNRVRILNVGQNPATPTPTVHGTLQSGQTGLTVPFVNNTPPNAIEVQFTGPPDQASVVSGRSFVVQNATGATLTGQVVFAPDQNTVRWVAASLPAGSYSVRLRGAGQTQQDFIASQGQALDGEGPLLPSGNNTPGGDFTFNLGVG